MAKSKHNLILIASGVVVMAILAIVAVMVLTNASKCTTDICTGKPNYVDGQVRKGVMCKSSTCKDEDVSKCCVERGNCSRGGTCTDHRRNILLPFKKKWQTSNTLCAKSACSETECCK